MKFTVVILQDDDTARLGCSTLEEAERVKQSFINYGKCQNVTIEASSDTSDTVAHYAAKQNLPVIDIHLSHPDPIDLKGMPYKDIK